MKCLRCGNSDPDYFYLGHRGYYCRKCISFSRVLLEEELEPLEYDINLDVSDYSFNYELTNVQLNASNKCLEYIKDSDVLLHCVCGAGKTEIVVKTISDYLSRGLKVGYAIARREVVIELSKRFEKIFNLAKVTAVYGGHNKDITGDLIVCTTHQLYRYYKTFDLLILDEVDAYPLKGNDTLMNISFNSCVGRIIYSTATIDKSLIKLISNRGYKSVEVYTRPNNLAMKIPKVFISDRLICYIYLFFKMKKIKHQCIIFVTSRRLCEKLYKFYKRFFNCIYVHAESENRDKNIKDFKNKKYQYIFATSVLERGITVKNVDVVILDFDDILEETNIIQMLGRVLRGNSTVGDCFILSEKLSKKIINCIKYIKKANSYL